jgi:hypothetical protein
MCVDHPSRRTRTRAALRQSSWQRFFAPWRQGPMHFRPGLNRSLWSNARNVLAPVGLDPLTNGPGDEGGSRWHRDHGIGFAKHIQGRDLFIIERRRNETVSHFERGNFVRGPGFGRFSGMIFDIFSTLSAMSAQPFSSDILSHENQSRARQPNDRAGWM